MARSTTESSSSTTSGIITDVETGQRHIPASVRADGSTRKQIKIRPGYRPPEDVEVYKNRAAHAFQTRGTGGVPGAEGLRDDSDKNESTKMNKNAKRREARKKAQSETTGTENGDDVGSASGKAAETTEAKEEKEPILSKAEQDEIDREKQARKLKKKLREARELQAKKEKGETLLHEQFEKVIKINELIRDLDKLGFDADGEAKAETQAG